MNEEAGLLEAAPPIDQDTYHQNSKEELEEGHVPGRQTGISVCPVLDEMCRATAREVEGRPVRGDEQLGAGAQWHFGRGKVPFSASDCGCFLPHRTRHQDHLSQRRLLGGKKARHLE